MSRRVFYAAKVNIHGNILSPNLKELILVHIPRVILNPREIKLRSWNWSFTDYAEISFEGKNLIIGNVTKSRHVKQKFKIGSSTQLQQTEHELAKTAFFVYDPVGEILAHESTSEISASDFRDLFRILLSRDPLVGEVIVKPVPIPHKIRNEVLSIQKVTSIKFELIHPNPGEEEYNIYQSIIDDAGLKTLDIKLVNPDGLKIIDSVSPDATKFTRTLENGISLVESGYGEVAVRGFDEYVRKGKRKESIIEKKSRKFSSSNEVRYIQIHEPDQERLLSRLYKFIMDIKSKVKGGEDIDV
ncbi:hypothetical protein [Brevibacillus sp. FIR094]|uniref:hypothetical protein n=1 Tax=Brevibacillus sp. FIR094 TaxID=3134809 RepID=UPI003D243825